MLNLNRDVELVGYNVGASSMKFILDGEDRDLGIEDFLFFFFFSFFFFLFFFFFFSLFLFFLSSFLPLSFSPNFSSF